MENIINEVKNMSDQMEIFLEAVKSIQNEVINIALIKKDKYDGVEEIITDVTYEMAYRIFELIDGYHNRKLKYKLTEIKSNKVVNADRDFHDLCEDYLKFTEK